MSTLFFALNSLLKSSLSDLASFFPAGAVLLKPVRQAVNVPLLFNQASLGTLKLDAVLKGVQFVSADSVLPPFLISMWDSRSVR